MQYRDSFKFGILLTTFTLISACSPLAQSVQKSRPFNVQRQSVSEGAANVSSNSAVHDKTETLPELTSRLLDSSSYDAQVEEHSSSDNLIRIELDEIQIQLFKETGVVRFQAPLPTAIQKMILLMELTLPPTAIQELDLQSHRLTWTAEVDSQTRFWTLRSDSLESKSRTDQLIRQHLHEMEIFIATDSAELSRFTQPQVN